MAQAIADTTPEYEERPVKVGVIQLSGFSLEAAERYTVQAAEDRPDVVVLPEAFAGCEPQNLADSPVIRAMQPYARRGSMYMVVNVIEANGDQTFNTTVILGRDGELVGQYRKVHIPVSTERDRDQDGGGDFPVFDLDFGRVGIIVCFDNYFPESVRSLALQGAEIVFFPHQEHYCWNGVEHVEILSRARAIENVLYMVPCGPTAAEEGPFGRTAVIDPTGKYRLQLPPHEEGYGSVTVDLAFISRVMIDDPQSGFPPMRTQMLVEHAEGALAGRRRSDAYSALAQAVFENETIGGSSP